MKACVIQPEYSVDYARSDELFERQLAMLDQCDASMDVIVLPEAADVPCLARTKEEFYASIERYNERLLEKVVETARRCEAVVFVNGTSMTRTGYRNTTYAFNAQGELVDCFYKQHLTFTEVGPRALDSDYSYEHSAPSVIAIDGVRYGFLTCYDFYFYELFASMARQKLDVIIGCSHQRSDTHAALEVMIRNLAYSTNAYVVRSSVSMGENSPLGGCSMIVAPDSTVMANLKSEIGMACATFDVHSKYVKPAGFGNPEKPHYEYIEDGRRPWKYRPAGSAIVRNDSQMPYPRVCAHRGFNTIAPENSMPAFGAAVALGAEEIEFDLWWTKDGEIVSLHDSTLQRVSTGEGNVWDYTYDELLAFDFGVKHGPAFEGLRILKFEEILKRFSSHVIMNVHIKTLDNVNPYNPEYLRKIVDLIEKYDCVKYCYFTSGNDTLLAQCREMAPHINRCVGGGDAPLMLVERALALDCKKIQLVKWNFNQEMINKAHEHGIRCNIFWSDDPEEAARYIDMGIDVLLANDYLRIARVVENKKKENSHGH